MTDTTDIAALMLDMRNRAITRIKNGGYPEIAVTATDLILIFDQLEAERQRADNANDGWLKVIAERDAAEQKSRNYEQVAHGLAEELAALKGDQVPVGIVAGYDIHIDENIIAWTEAGADLPIGTELFTAPQKPVVLPKEIEPWEVIDILDPTANPEDYACRESVQAAGCIVKDGE